MFYQWSTLLFVSAVASLPEDTLLKQLIVSLSLMGTFVIFLLDFMFKHEPEILAFSYTVVTLIGMVINALFACFLGTLAEPMHKPMAFYMNTTTVRSL